LDERATKKSLRCRKEIVYKGSDPVAQNGNSRLKLQEHRMKKIVAASLALAVLVMGSTWAHHNMSAVFDVNQRFTVTGTLMKLDWRNPTFSCRLM